jgi:menaquinone-dependent protoporphyrinogen oxidase
MARRTLIVYGTTEGHTENVVTAISAPLLEQGHEVVAARVEEAPSAVDGFDAVVVGSSVHLGKHHEGVVAWARRNAMALAQRPSAFFEVCLSAVGDEDRQAEARSYVDDFTEQTGWHPDLVGIFGGALRYTRYGFAKKRLLRSVARKDGLATDTRRDFVYTDYDAVRQFAEDVAAAARTH